MKPITIIGGGLAGLSLGISLRRRGVPVTIHEAGSYPRHRVCGEFINGVSDVTLSQLGIEDDLADARKLSTTVWHLKNRRLFKNSLAVPAGGISRFELDQRLADRFQKTGGQLVTHSRMRHMPTTGLIWAAGRIPETKSKWIGLKVHVFNLRLEADLEMHLGSRGYVGLAPVEGNRVNICGLFERRNLHDSGISLLHGYLTANDLTALHKRLQTVERDPASFTGVSAFALGPQRVAPESCVLGDSESMIPPFTGNGMSMAFEAAETASGIIADYATGEQTWRDTATNVRLGLQKRFRTRLFTARVLHPLLFSEFGKALLATTARSGLLPFGTLSRLLR